METFEKLKEAKQLLDEGIIDDDEYQKLKTRLLSDLDSEHSAHATPNLASNNAIPPTKVVPTTAEPNKEGATTGMKVLSFLFPIVGLILFLMDKDKKPVAAKDEIKWAGIGFGVGILLYFFTLAIGGCTADMYY